MNNDNPRKVAGSTRSGTANLIRRSASTGRLVLFSALVILFAAQSCRPGRELVPTEPVVMAPSRAVASMHAAQPAYDFFTARFSGTAIIDGSSYNVAGNIRVRKDSAIYVSVAPILGIEVARLLVTPDTVRLLNRLESTYFEGETRFLANFLNADIDFFMLQSLLTGTDITHFTTDNFRVSSDRDMLLLNSPDRRRIRATSHGSSLEHNLWLNKESFRIMQASLYDKSTQNSIQVRYPSHTTVEGQAFPSQLRMVVIDPDNRAELDISLTRITINQPQQITFSVPPGYVPMRF